MKRKSQAADDAHYADGAYYDQAYRRRRHDVLFYTDLANRHGGSILELGCGTGRVSFAIANAGHEVIGVDRMPAMLAQANKRKQALPKTKRQLLTYRKGDLRRIRLKKRF